MKSKLDRITIILIGISMGFTYGMIIYERMIDSSEQQILLQKIKNLAEQNILVMEIVPGRIKRQGIPLTLEEIASVQAFLKEADISPVGGHNYRIYECVLTVEVEKNVRMSFWGTVYGAYEENKHALYLVGYQSGHSKEPRPIRVKSLGKWIVEKVSQEPRN